MIDFMTFRRKVASLYDRLGESGIRTSRQNELLNDWYRDAGDGKLDEDWPKRMTICNVWYKECRH